MSGLPIWGAIKISQNGLEVTRSTTTADGTYISKNIPFGIYNIKAWSFGYISDEQDVEVVSDDATEVNFSLQKKRSKKN